MTRRRKPLQDPTSSRAVPEEVLTRLVAVLGELSERERAILIARFGLANGYPMRYDDLGQIHGVTRARIKQIESKVFRKLRHPSLAHSLATFVGEDFAKVRDHVRERIYGRRYQVRRGEVARCEKHGWFDPGLTSDVTKPMTCDQCPCPLPVSETGRPRAYCSDACRQAAYRARKTAKRKADSRTPRRRRAARG